MAMPSPSPLPTERHKLELLRAGARQDALDPTLVRFASTLVRSSAPDDWLGQARSIFRWVRDGIRYQHDPNRAEEFADGLSVLSRGWDDCDGKARLAVALMRSAGLEAEVHPVWRAGTLAHVQVRVRFPGSGKTTGNRRGWLIGDPTIRGAELGQPVRAIASRPGTGKMPLAGGGT